MTQSEQSTLDDTNGMRNEEAVQIAAVKEKQIDLLSSMLAQKETDIKNLKDEN